MQKQHYSNWIYCTGAAEVVDLSQEQDPSAGPSETAALHDPAPRANTRATDNHRSNSDVEYGIAEAEVHTKPSVKKTSGRTPRGRQKVTQGVAASEEAGGSKQAGNTIQRRSKSGVEVEVEEI